MHTRQFRATGLRPTGSKGTVIMYAHTGTSFHTRVVIEASTQERGQVASLAAQRTDMYLPIYFMVAHSVACICIRTQTKLPRSVYIQDEGRRGHCARSGPGKVSSSPSFLPPHWCLTPACFYCAFGLFFLFPFFLVFFSLAFPFHCQAFP
ncbi:hypothetical protein LZ31DRAFT_200423 [Colletotrichum somersetense]|nr:hypothetical protein LZ31DRAFT_200423 [Colletotrichum somersetense]